MLILSGVFIFTNILFCTKSLKSLKSAAFRCVLASEVLITLVVFYPMYCDSVFCNTIHKHNSRQLTCPLPLLMWDSSN